MQALRQQGDAVRLAVRVQPRSSKSGISGMYGDSVRIHLKAAPVDDAANRECCELLAKLLGVAHSRVSVATGRSSRSKILNIEGVSCVEVEDALRPVLTEKTTE